MRGRGIAIIKIFASISLQNFRETSAPSFYSGRLVYIASNFLQWPPNPSSYTHITHTFTRPIMKFSIITACTAAILLAQSANAWTFTWRDSNGTPYTHNGGDGNMNCAGINHAKGQVFDWDRGFGSDCCISLYSGSGCNGDPQGLSCPDWSKASSGRLLSYKVTDC